MIFFPKNKIKPNNLWCTLGFRLCIYTLHSSFPICCIKRRRHTQENSTMEASLFTKTLELVPSIKSRGFPYSNGSSPQFHFKRNTRCNLSFSSSSSNDAGQPVLEADWRSFRARLVANEQAQRPNELLSTLDPDSPMDQPPQVAIGDKWAHTIREPEKGCLLIATEKLDGVHIFERAVVLLLSTGPVGPYGIILNRPSLMSIKEMRSTVLDGAGTFSDRPLFYGGPLEEGLFLINPKRGYDNDRVARSGVFEEVMKGMYYGTKESAGCAAEMVKRNVIGVGDFRFFDGYCGWEKEQLREEINGGYWTVAACSRSVIGHEAAATLGFWEEVLWLLGPKKVW